MVTHLTKMGQRFGGRDDWFGFECAELRGLQETQVGMSRMLLSI